MNDVLSVLYSLPFAFGGVFGAVAMHLYQRAVCRHLDKTHPLPDGKKRPVPHVGRQFLGGLLALAVVGYVLLQTAQTEAHYKALAGHVAECQADLIKSILRGREISKENDDLSVRQRDLFAELEELQGVWLTRLVSPDDPTIAKLDNNDPRREAWAIDVTIVYNERAAKLRAEVTDISKRQAELVKERADNELPDPRCAQP